MVLERVDYVKSVSNVFVFLKAKIWMFENMENKGCSLPLL